MDADILIVGGGVAGVALAYELAPRARVILLEKEGALGTHATGRSAAEWSIVHAHGLARALTRASEEFLRRPPSDFASSALMHQRGNVVYAMPGDIGALGAVMEDASLADRRLQMLTPAAAVALAPFLDSDLIAGALFDPSNCEIDVDALMSAYVRAARRGGVTILTDCELRGGVRKEGGWRMATTHGTISARTVVNAAGPWANLVSDRIGVERLPLVSTRRTAITFDAQGVDVHGLPSVDDIASGFYMKPEGGRLMACPGDDTPTEPGDAAPEELDVATAAWMAEQVMGRPVERIAARWAGIRMFATDRDPVAGWDRVTEGVFWLAGLGGSGLMTAPALARGAAALLLGEDTPSDLMEGGVTARALSPGRLRS